MPQLGYKRGQIASHPAHKDHAFEIFWQIMPNVIKKNNYVIHYLIF